MSIDKMCYVAVDRNSKDIAYAATADMPEHKDNTAESVSEWIKEGAIVLYVDVETAREMLSRYKP